MALDSNVLRAMQATGCTVDQIIAAVAASESVTHEKVAARREAERLRKRRQRAVSRGVPDVPRDTADKLKSDDISTIAGAMSHGTTGTPPRAHVEDNSLFQEIELQEVKKVSRQRATRLPAEFEPDIEFAISLGLSPAQTQIEIAKFRDYWNSKGSGATKTDWPATWRNWARTALERLPRSRGSPSGGEGVVARRKRELAERIENEHGIGRERGVDQQAPEYVAGFLEGRR